MSLWMDYHIFFDLTACSHALKAMLLPPVNCCLLINAFGVEHLVE